uniref:Uncharacterized protein n=1 Tax=Clytia hemisphaerica TaxID=252671 RepID=A0A7M5TT39_9CNID
MMKEFTASMSVPAISLNDNEEENANERGRTERSESFKEMMRHSMPSVARNASPKPHRKHHHHHHHHRHHKSKSPSSSRQDLTSQDDAFSNDVKSSFLSIGNQAARLRSSSDSSIHGVEHRFGDHRSSEDSPLLRRAIYGRQKSKYDDDHDVDNVGVMLSFPNIGNEVDDTHEEDFDQETTTISRDIIGDSVGKHHDINSGETLTKRRDELVSQVQRNENSRSKKRVLKMIDQLLEQCTDNFHQVERDIDFQFARLYVALENRKKELVEEAKQARDQKIESLKEAKRTCLTQGSKATLSVQSSFSSDNDSDNGECSPRRDSGGEQQDSICLQQNGILEPWKSFGKQEKDQMKADLNKVVDSLSNGNSLMLGTLEEGNTCFDFNEESIEILSNIGKLKDSLSSAQFSFTKGLHYGIALAGEAVHFEVHTRSINNEVSFNSMDDIKCQIYSTSGECIEVSQQVSLRRSLSNSRVVSHNNKSSLNRFYSYDFTAPESGKYEIRIAINGVEIKSSPFVYSVYPKVNLAFDVKSPGERTEVNLTDKSSGTLESRRKNMSRRQSSEDSDWRGNNWIVQKGDKSSILRSINDVPSYIYALPSVKGFCAWKIRVTSACESARVLIYQSGLEHILVSLILMSIFHVIFISNLMEIDLKEMVQGVFKYVVRLPLPVSRSPMMSY